MEAALYRRAVSDFSCSTVAEEALRTWGIVRKHERAAADPLDAFKSGARVGGIIVPIGEGYLPVDLLRKGDEVANLVDSSLTGKRVERPSLLRGNAESSCTRDLGVAVSAFPHLTPITTA